ncbi:hypothetical protein [Luteimonas saliphila]|uniref:hypothetical protein n=1 Tax=Luteimonas saliphila TaxID=2804919 RepID=UPI00192D3E89|nr:hypothetical protein [Luteimonas saliphila]
MSEVIQLPPIPDELELRSLDGTLTVSYYPTHWILHVERGDVSFCMRARPNRLIEILEKVSTATHKWIFSDDYLKVEIVEEVWPSAPTLIFGETAWREWLATARRHLVRQGGAPVDKSASGGP